MKMYLQYFAEPQNNPTAGNEPNGDKIFTQEDVNRIVSKRLAEEKSKSEAALLKREEELAKKELDFKARMLLKDKNLPDKLLDVLAYSDEESLINNIKIVEELYSSVETKMNIGTGFTPSQDYGRNSNIDIREAMKLPR